MNNRNVAVLLLAGCALFAIAPALVAADPRQSHRPLPGVDGSFDEKELAERLQPAQDMTVLRSLAEKMLKHPEEFPKLTAKRKALLEQLLKNQNTRNLLKDKELQKLFHEAMKNPKVSEQQLEELRKQLDQIKPEDRKKLADLVQKYPNDFKLDDKDRQDLRKLADKKKADLKPEDLNKWAELAKKLQQNPNLPNDHGELDPLKRLLPDVQPPSIMPGVPPDVPPIQPPGQPQPLPKPKALPNPQSSPVSNPPMPPKPPKVEAKQESPTASSQDLNDLSVTGLLKLADWLQDIDPNDEQLASLAEFVRNKAEEKGDDQGTLDAIGKSADWLSSLHLGEWHFSDETAEKAGSLFDKFNASSLPNTGKMPSGPSLSSSGASMPSGSSSSDLDKLAAFVVWTVSLAFVGFVVWRLLRWYGTSAEGRRGFLAHWPVRPGDVTTRGDLVRAFEYLALKLLGIDAQHRHHLDLARRLGGPAPQTDDGRRQAANHLAHLYELARYAPEDEPLPETELAAARRALSFLAGGAAAA